MDFVHSPIALDSFFYTGDEFLFEDLLKYRKHGLHPVIIGDVLPKPCTCASHPEKTPRYRIILKLGRGAFSTVWLARDLAHKRFVSVKIGVGTKSILRSNEAEILASIHGGGFQKPGYDHIIDLFDDFIIEGPNGFHECLVTEVIAPLAEPWILDQCPSHVVRQLSRQLLEGPAPRKPGVALPQLDQFEEDDIVEHFSNPELVPVVPRDTSLSMQHLPPYLVGAVDMVDFFRSRRAFHAGPDTCLKILDFGRARWANKPSKPLLGATPQVISPPENILCQKYVDRAKAGSMWDIQADIWAVGCTMYEIQTRSRLMNTFCPLDKYLSAIIKLGGPAPRALAEQWPKHEFQDEVSATIDRGAAWEEREKHNPWANKEKRDLFVDLVKKMVVTNSEERLPMSKLLDHPFLSTEEDTANVDQVAS
ncbi:hypothetical protein G7046_g9635 [Stylonectria norvegica]|nr:hypothetical protein G7046_g9635 [Stylonectria norvegica]